MFIKTALKDSGKVNRIVNYLSKWNMYLYFLIWLNLLISAKKMLCRKMSRGVSCDSYNFLMDMCDRF